MSHPYEKNKKKRFLTLILGNLEGVGRKYPPHKQVKCIRELPNRVKGLKCEECKGEKCKCLLMLPDLMVHQRI